MTPQELNLILASFMVNKNSGEIFLDVFVPPVLNYHESWVLEAPLL